MFTVPCPACHAGLRVKDAKVIGKRARCTKCGHSFVLTVQAAEEPVELELVDPTPPPATPPATELPTGTSARWVPDEPAATPPATTSPHAAPPPGPALAQEEATPLVVDVAPDFPVVDDATAPSSRLDDIRRRAKRRSKHTRLITGVVLLAVTGLSVGAVVVLQSDPATDTGKTEVATNTDWERGKAELAEDAAAVQNVSPTSGRPIDLRYLPPGANIIVHLRPSQLWASSDSRRELMACLGPLGTWLAETIRTQTRFEPEEIEQLTFTFSLGPRESEPELGVVVRLRKEQQRSLLIQQRFRALRDAAADADLFVDVDGSRAWLLVDEKTFSVGPAGLSDDMIDAMGGPAIPSRSIEALVERTDQDRHLTVLFDLQALRIHTPTLFDSSLHPALNQFLDWFGKDVEGAAMSLHFGDTLFAQTLLRSTNDTTPAKLSRKLQQQVVGLPQAVLEMVRHMRPGRAGPRRIIARFPAMTKAVSMATRSGLDERFVQLTTLLPERAIPNLAIGTLLAWDESTRTDFSQALKPANPETDEKLPRRIIERLAKSVDIEFVRTPLEEAFTYLGDETSVTFVVDGDGLKLAGYTKNMAQTFNLGNAPAVSAVREILKQYDKMVLVADESTHTVTVTTVDVVEAQQLKVFSLD